MGAIINNAYATGNISGNDTVGGLVGGNKNLTVISNSYATGNVTGANFVGGLVGSSIDATINRVYATGSVTATASVVGGLVGINSGILGGGITYAYAKGDVNGDSSVGGLVGYNAATISNSFAIGNVNGNDHVGGLVGDNGSNFSPSTSTTTYGSIINTSAMGTVTTVSGSAGGLVGANNGGTIKNSFAAGRINGGGSSFVGGLTSGTFSGNVINSFWDTTTSGQTTLGDGTGLTTAQMQQQASFTGWDFVNTWHIFQGVSYPTVRGFDGPPFTNPPITNPPVTPGTSTPSVVPPTPPGTADVASNTGILLASLDNNKAISDARAALYQQSKSNADSCNSCAKLVEVKVSKPEIKYLAGVSAGERTGAGQIDKSSSIKKDLKVKKEQSKIKFNIHAQRTWNCSNPLEGGQAVLHRRQA